MPNIPLSPVEHLFTGVRSQPITLAFSYPYHIEDSQLKRSLDTISKQFSPLRSKLRKVSDTELELVITDDELHFEVRESSKKFDGNDPITDYIEPVKTYENEPLTRITITHTPGSPGSVLAVSISHALVDGFSFFHFLSSWSRATRNERYLPPHIPRDVFTPYLRDDSIDKITQKHILDSAGLFLDSRREPVNTDLIRTERLIIQNDTIQKTIDEVKHTHNINVSKNDIVSALLWQEYLSHWTEANDDESVFITCPFDFRRVLSGFPKNYFGCALAFATAKTSLDQLKHSSIGDIAVLIKKAVNDMKEEHIQRSLTTLESFRQQNGLEATERIHLRHPRNGMIVTNLSRMPLQELDFGSGSPESFIAYNEIEQSAALFPHPDGLEVYVAHPLQ